MLSSYAPWDGMGRDLLWIWCRHRFKDCFTDFKTVFFPSPTYVITFGQQPPVLHWNYNGDVAPLYLAIFGIFSS